MEANNFTFFFSALWRLIVVCFGFVFFPKWAAALCNAVIMYQQYLYMSQIYISMSFISWHFYEAFNDSDTFNNPGGKGFDYYMETFVGIFILIDFFLER